MVSLIFMLIAFMLPYLPPQESRSAGRTVPTCFPFMRYPVILCFAMFAFPPICGLQDHWHHLPVSVFGVSRCWIFCIFVPDELYTISASLFNPIPTEYLRGSLIHPAAGDSLRTEECDILTANPGWNQRDEAPVLVPTLTEDQVTGQ
jgi:hypothetical protein